MMVLVIHAEYRLAEDVYGTDAAEVAAHLEEEGGGTLHGAIETVYPAPCRITAHVGSREDIRTGAAVRLVVT